MLRNGWDTKTTWNGKTETFIVLSPQCPTSYGMWPQAFIDDLLKYAKANLRVDTNRIYLTGLSMGAGGSNRYLSTTNSGAGHFSAAAVICTPNTFQNGKYVAEAKLPYWAFHAKDDPTVSYQYSYDAINKINAAGAEVKPMINIWPTGGHNVWDRVYKDTNRVWENTVTVYEWFLGQNKSLAINKIPVANAGADLRVSPLQGTVKLDGSASKDSDGKLVRYVWKKISGPNSGNITTKTGAASSTTVTGLSYCRKFISLN